MNYEFGRISVKKRTIPEWLSMYLFVFPFFLSFFMDFLKIPSFIKYSLDLVWILMFVFMFAKKRIQLKKKMIPFAALIGIWLLYVIIIYLFNYQSVFYFLWGIRNNFRFYVAFFAFALFLNEEDIKSIFRFIDFIFWINIAVTLYQFFVLEYKQDYLGGIFGVERGCNAYSLVFLSFVCIKSLLNFMNQKEKPSLCIMRCGFSLVIAAMAELKFFFIVFSFIIIISAIMTKFSWKKFVVIFAVAFVFMFASSILEVLFGDYGNLSFSRIVELATTSNYATEEDLGRFTAIPTISNNFLTDIWSRLFGMGIGNCDTSAFSICNTPFFIRYESLHYSWFSSAFLYLETGFIGLGMNLAFYIVCLVLSCKKYNDESSNKLFCQISIIFSILCIILTFYNSALRKEVAYIAYFVLALPFVSNDLNENYD